MPNTTPDGIYYPDDSTEVDDLANLFGAQATSVQAALAAMRDELTPKTVADSGWSIAGIHANTGWSGVSDSNGNSSGLKGGIRKVGNLVELRYRVTRTGADIVANSQGNVGDQVCSTITNTAFRPAGNVYSYFDFGPGLGTGGIRIEPDGTVNIVDAYPGAHIKTGYTIQICAVYFTG